MSNHIIVSRCAGPSDITAFTQIRPVRPLPLSQISLTFRLDGVAQEFNETFSIEFENFNADNSSFFPLPSQFPDITIGHLNGTIVDQDRE